MYSYVKSKKIGKTVEKRQGNLGKTPFRLGKLWKHIVFNGKLWKTMETYGKLWKIEMTMERSTIFDGKAHYKW